MKIRLSTQEIENALSWAIRDPRQTAPYRGQNLPRPSVEMIETDDGHIVADIEFHDDPYKEGQAE